MEIATNNTPESSPIIDGIDPSICSRLVHIDELREQLEITTNNKPEKWSSLSPQGEVSPVVDAQINGRLKYEKKTLITSFIYIRYTCIHSYFAYDP